MERPEFKRVLATLRRFKSEDDQITYVYVMRKTDEAHQFHIVVDSDPETSDDNGDGIIQPNEEGAPPGTEYDGASFPLMQKTVDSATPQADPDFAVDQWGISLSGYAPIPGDDNREYFLGVDTGNKQLLGLRNRLRTILSLLSALAIVGYAVFWWPRGRGGTLASTARARLGRSRTARRH